MSDLGQRIRQIVAGIIHPCPVAPLAMADDLHLVNDLGADSLEGVEIGIACEDEFGIDLTDDAMEAIQTVGDLVTAVETRIMKASAA